MVQKIDSALRRKLGFVNFSADACIYKGDDTIATVLIALYEDDLIILANSREEISKIKSHLSEAFKMKDLGEIQSILGLQIKRDRSKRSIEISQTKYISDTLEKFGFHNCKTVNTPFELNEKLHKTTTEEEGLVDTKKYQGIIGSLLYAMRGSRPDIAYAVTRLSQYCNNPSHDHLIALKRVMRYLKGTINKKLLYKKSEDSNYPQLVGYSDADWGNNVDDRRSITGYVFMLGNGSISWATKTQPTVALSTVEAEYMAVAQATQECIWWRIFLKDSGLDMEAATTIYCDNQGAIVLGNHPEHHARTEHINIRHHFIRKQIEMRSIHLEYISTAGTVADQLTKSLAADRHNTLARAMGLF